MSGFSGIDHSHMARALNLAARARFTSKPNPMVGCVIARGETVLGEGFHARAGEPHAEVHALRAAGEAARGATAYVTLEPCAHHGRTPPCADALIAAGVGRVVAACEDPFTQVAGRGFAALRAADIAVECGLMAGQARELNAGFFSRIQRGRPRLRVKLAMSLDGRTALADGTSKWITSEASRADVQRWRAGAGAILTGSGTVIDDDPRLTVRIDAPHVAPLRVILDRAGKLPGDARVLTDGLAPTLVLHGPGTGRSYPPSVQTRMISLTEDGSGLNLTEVLAALAERDIGELLVESGATLAGGLLRQGLVDELLIYVAPLLLGARGRPLLAGIDPIGMGTRLGLSLIDTRQIGPDLRLRFRPHASAPG